MMFAYGTQTFTMPDMITGTTPQVFDTGVIGYNGAEWVAVPEPATVLFGLVGLVTLAIARRRKQLQ
jgi:hypothetical protein